MTGGRIDNVTGTHRDSADPIPHLFFVYFAFFCGPFLPWKE
jgi:hypothetical protein